GPAIVSLAGSPCAANSGSQRLPGYFCGCSRQCSGPNASTSLARRSASNCSGSWMKGTGSFIGASTLAGYVHFGAALAELARFVRHALCQRVVFGDAVFLRVIAHVLRDLHRAEMRAAHRAEMRELVRILRQRLVVEFLRLFRIEAEVELILPAEFKARFRQRV